MSVQELWETLTPVLKVSCGHCLVFKVRCILVLKDFCERVVHNLLQRRPIMYIHFVIKSDAGL